MRTLHLIPALSLMSAACAAPVDGSAVEAEPDSELPVRKSEEGKFDASAEAVFLEMELDGELVVDFPWSPRQQIESQLLYTVGQLNGDNSVSRLDKVELEDVRTLSEGGRTRIVYHARMPVAWGRRANVPTEYTFELPRDMSSAALGRFATTYGHDCVDWSAHDVDSGSMWYYFRPHASRCTLADEDVVRTTATVTPSDLQTTGKFPEYDRVWDDGELRAVAVFGKNEDGATASWDAGISAYNSFLSAMKRELGEWSLTTVPESVPNDPGVSVPDVTFRATLPDGRTIEVVALLVDGVRTAGPTFDARYRELTPRADFIAYNGHSGLGANIRALASKGRWVRGQYAVVFMNGCDTYAYVDSALWDAHAAVNPDDPAGTKHLDIVMNGMPSYFHSNARGTTAILRALIDIEAPRTYEQIFEGIDDAQVVLVSGEQDNTFVPGGGGGGGEEWEGLSDASTVERAQEKRYGTPSLEPGRYVFELRGEGGDADLYVRIGTEPTTRLYDCRPYLSSSNESCEVTLDSAAPIHVMVRGYSGTTSYQLTGTPR